MYMSFRHLWMRFELLCLPLALMGCAWTMRAVAANSPSRILVFSKTAGFRHASIPNGIAAIRQLAAENILQVTATEDAAIFSDAGLATYDAVVFLMTTGDIL